MCGGMQHTRIPSIEQLLRVSMSVNAVTLPSPSSTDLPTKPQIVHELLSPSMDIDPQRPANTGADVVFLEALTRRRCVKSQRVGIRVRVRVRVRVMTRV